MYIVFSSQIPNNKYHIPTPSATLQVDAKQIIIIGVLYVSHDIASSNPTLVFIVTELL